MNLNLKNLTGLFIFILILSCNENKTKQDLIDENFTKTEIKYAKGFEIFNYKNHKKLIIKAPFLDSTESFEFLLSKNPKSNDFIKVPITNIVVTSTTHIPMLESLNEENKLIGFPNTNYISSERTRARINKGDVKELGNEENMNTELLLAMNPDVLIGFSLNSNNKMYNTIQKIGIPVIMNGDWLEKTPLGRAEWIKFFGVLFDKEKEADSIFNELENNYLTIKNLASKSDKKPTIISGGLFKDIWNLPAGESFEASFLKDANTQYLWQDSKGTGSLSLNLESVFDKGKDADLWISPSFHSSLNSIENANEIYSKFKAFKNKQVYSFVNKKGKTGGLLYFELAPSRPDLVLKDLIKIAHPELLQNEEFTFFEKLK
jgi:iron complex transport system substrate-binding protein